MPHCLEGPPLAPGAASLTRSAHSNHATSFTLSAIAHHPTAMIGTITSRGIAPDTNYWGQPHHGTCCQLRFSNNYAMRRRRCRAKGARHCHEKDVNPRSRCSWVRIATLVASPGHCLFQRKVQPACRAVSRNLPPAASRSDFDQYVLPTIRCHCRVSDRSLGLSLQWRR